MLKRFSPSIGDLLVVLLGASAPALGGAAPDPAMALDIAHAVWPMVLAGASALGGILGKAVLVGGYSYARAWARSKLTNKDPSDDVGARAVMDTVDRLDPSGKLPDDDVPCPPAPPPALPPDDKKG